MKQLPTRIWSEKSAGVTAPRWFEWFFVTLSGWMVVGIHIDAWAHHQFVLETFFTPWHGLLYAGFLGTASLLLVTFWRNLSHAGTWQDALPGGYNFSLLGVFVFFVGAIGDMAWHTLFGIEVSLEVLLSPPHLLLGIGGGLIITGPVRALLRRIEGHSLRSAHEEYRPWVDFAPALLALAFLLALLYFFTAFGNSLTREGTIQTSFDVTQEQVASQQSLGIADILLQTVFMMGVILFAACSWTPFYGSNTLIVTISTTLAASIHEEFFLVVVALVAGLLIDLLAWILKPKRTDWRRLGTFAFATPLIFYGLYFAYAQLIGALTWRVSLWGGAMMLAGITGWLLSFAFAAPVASSQPESTRPRTSS